MTYLLGKCVICDLGSYKQARFQTHFPSIYIQQKVEFFRERMLPLNTAFIRHLGFALWRYFRYRNVQKDVQRGADPDHELEVQWLAGFVKQDAPEGRCY